MRAREKQQGRHGPDSIAISSARKGLERGTGVQNHSARRAGRVGAGGCRHLARRPPQLNEPPARSARPFVMGRGLDLLPMPN